MRINIMKNILIKTGCLAALVLILMACNDTMGDPDYRLTEVKALIEPASGKTIKLEPLPSASVYFEWEYIEVEKGGTAVYQIAFDKPDGDFSDPVYMVSSGNNGFNNHVTLSHKQLNKIAGMAGIFPSETGSVKWTVFSSKGTKAMKAASENTITITRLAGFEEVPIDVYVTGEGSEGGADLSKAQKMKAVAGGEFEVYTKLKANSPYYFTDSRSGTPRKFYTADGLVKENGSSKVPTEGIYRITLDFNTGASTYTLVLGIGFYFSPAGSLLFELPYKGNGIFQAKETVTFKQEGWGRDERYKFRMFVKENGGAGEMKELEWGTLNQTDSRPTPTTAESYYYLKLLTNLTQWDNKWKLMGDFDGVPAVYTIYLQADKPYTHSVTK